MFEKLSNWVKTVLIFDDFYRFALTDPGELWLDSWWINYDHNILMFLYILRWQIMTELPGFWLFKIVLVKTISTNLIKHKFIIANKSSQEYFVHLWTN